MVEVPLELLEVVQDAVRRAYRQGYEDGERTQREREEEEPFWCAPSTPAIAMEPREKDAGESYRDFFARGVWPKDVSDQVRSLSVRNLQLSTKAMNAVSHLVEVDDRWTVTIGHILAIPPSKMLGDVRARRGLTEAGIKQLLDELKRYGVVLLHPAV